MKNIMRSVTGIFQGKKIIPPLPTGLEEIQTHLKTSLAQYLSIAPEAIDPEQAFSDLGFDSLQAVRFSGELEDWLKIKLPPTLLWEFPNVNELAEKLARELKILPEQVLVAE